MTVLSGEGEGAGRTGEPVENPTALWARAFLDELARGGVREVVLAPGSRSTPLVLAAAEDGRFRLFPLLDERSAGFFAVGLARATGRPPAVITTSGTAVANLMPAVAEASAGEVPLLLLTADRPHRFRDSDANQTMDQVRLFGGLCRGFFDVPPPRAQEVHLRHLRVQAARAVALAVGTPPGPVHVNFPFDKPLEPLVWQGRRVGEGEGGKEGTGDGEGPRGEETGGLWAEKGEGWLGRAAGEPFTRILPRRGGVGPLELAEFARSLQNARRGLIVAGPVRKPREVGQAVLALGAATGFPVLADPLSGARFAPSGGALRVAGYDLFLRSPAVRESLAPDVVVRVGASPTSGALLEYLGAHAGARQLVVDDGHRWKDHPALAHEYYLAPPEELLAGAADLLSPGADGAWKEAWGRVGEVVAEVRRAWPPAELLEGDVLGAVVESLPEGACLLVASSMPIRELDAFVSPSERPLRVFGNRGVSGIDGLVSTTAGLAAAASPVVGVLGDLAFLHDLGALVAVKTLGLEVLFVVINNNGGGIFHTLPVRAFEPAFTPYFVAPHGLEFEGVARWLGFAYEGVEDRPGLEAALARGVGGSGTRVVEVKIRRVRAHARRAEFIRRVVEEAERTLGVARPPEKNSGEESRGEGPDAASGSEEE